MPEAGDPDPYQFNPGETYDLNYTDPSGNPVTIDNAVVLRSDTYSSGVNVVVFEGEDQNGNTVQVCWAPDYDLQNWYDNAGGSPRFYTSDRSTTTYGHVCLASDTLIETPRGGAVRLSDVRTGDKVLTVMVRPRRSPGSGGGVLQGSGPPRLCCLRPARLAIDARCACPGSIAC